MGLGLAASSQEPVVTVLMVRTDGGEVVDVGEDATMGGGVEGEVTSGMRLMLYRRPFMVLARVAVGMCPGLGCLQVAEV